MKKFILPLLIALFIPAILFAQEHKASERLTHLGVGVSLNIFDDKFPDRITDNIKFEFTPIFTIASEPELYLVGNANYSTQGLAGFGGGAMATVKNFPWGKLLIEGGFVPVEFTTNTTDSTKDIQSNGTGTAKFGATLSLREQSGFRPTIRLVREVNVDMSSDVAIKEKYTNLTTITIGVVF